MTGTAQGTRPLTTAATDAEAEAARSNVANLRKAADAAAAADAQQQRRLDACIGDQGRQQQLLESAERVAGMALVAVAAAQIPGSKLEPVTDSVSGAAEGAVQGADRDQPDSSTSVLGWVEWLRRCSSDGGGEWVLYTSKCSL